ncbi:MAG: flagellar basal body protein [Alphaproteobacteria bacterium]|nr:flagellar basal body protein [Alphaproteobacteria bacterium]
MVDAILRPALSGLSAAATRVAVSADNIANAQTTGRIGAAPGSEDAAYQARQVTQTAIQRGGVRTTVGPADPATVAVFDPRSPLANSDGLVAAPNVDFGQELVNQSASRTAFAASAALVRAVDEQSDTLLDILS